MVSHASAFFSSKWSLIDSGALNIAQAPWFLAKVNHNLNILGVRKGVRDLGVAAIQTVSSCVSSNSQTRQNLPA